MLFGSIGTLLLCLLCRYCHAQAPVEFTESFEGDEPSWSVFVGSDAPVRFEQLRSAEDVVSGQRSEQLLLQSAVLTPDLELRHWVPPARVFSEVKATLWVRSNCADIRLALLLRFPHQIDPRTGQTLEQLLIGEAYTRFGQWQQLSCETSDSALRSLMIRVRGQLADSGSPVTIDDREIYISRAVLLFSAPPGNSQLSTDELTLSPVVAPSPRLVPPVVASEGPGPRLELGDDRILKDGKPFFPLFTTYHGERLDTILWTQVNMLWVEDYEDQPLVSALAAADVGVIAQPPPIAHDETLLGKEALVPFADSTSPVWAWMLGKDIPAEELRYVSYWSRAVRDADRRMRRLVMANVLGAERDFHRPLSLLGSSEYTMQSGISPEMYLKRLAARQDAALPGKPMFTFIATEPADARIDLMPPGTPLPVLEPEQIWLQGYTALAAGFKGIGFGRRYTFDEQSAGLNERALAMKLFNLHVKVLEPWLATGQLLYHLDARAGSGDRDLPGGKPARSPLSSAWDPQVVPAGSTREVTALSSQVPIKASVFHTEYGLLILLVWYEPGAQFVPGPQLARDVKFLIRGDAAQSWEVTATEVSQSNLAMNRVAGGTEIVLKDFDQHAAIVVTHDATVINTLKENVRRHRQEAAATTVALAELKLQRVQSVHDKLVHLQANPVSEANDLLAGARRNLTRARQEIDAGHDDDAVQVARSAMASLRRLQRRHWEHVNASIPSPLSSPYACSFQTLPEHWRLMARLGHNDLPSANLLPSGDFENLEELQASWVQELPAQPSSHFGEPSIQLDADDSTGQRFLSISLTPPRDGETTGGTIDSHWTMISPQVPYRTGELLFISGRIRIPHISPQATGDFAIYDTLLGRTGALRFADPSADWQRFYFIREAPGTGGPGTGGSGDGVLRLRFELSTWGTVELDDIQVVALPPPLGVKATSD